MPRAVGRRAPIFGHFRAPASKPETQRGLIMAALADGRSVLHDPLVSRETQMMMGACRALGATVTESPGRLEVDGIGRHFEAGAERPPAYVWAAGSALVARLFAVIGSAWPGRVVIDGNCVLRSRPFEPLFRALRGKGVGFGFFDGENRLPCAALSTSLPGGRYQLGTSVSSQFITALLVPAPLALTPTRIELTGPHYSLSYIRQTILMMERFGVPVQIGDGMRELVVPNDRRYAPQEVAFTGDWTSASYLLGAAFVTRGRITLDNLDRHNAQGERAILDILQGLGAKARWLDGSHRLEFDCTALPEQVDAAFDLSDCPNILPTVAAVAATVAGRVRITGARLTQNHKSRRIDAMAAELGRAEIPVELLYDAEGMVDGLEVRGRHRHAGGFAFASHGDHRILMSTVLLALAGERPSLFNEAEDTADSFPEFAAMLGLDRTAHMEGRDERELVAG